MTEEAQDIVAILTESGLRTRRERSSFVAKLKDQMGLTFAEIGKQLNVTRQRAQQLYVLHRLLQRQALGRVSYGGFAEAEDDDEDFVEPKEFTAPAVPEDAKQQIVAFFNQNGFLNQFQVATGPPVAPEYDFTLIISDAMADAWENRARVMREFEALCMRLGYEYDKREEPGGFPHHRHAFHFFKTSIE